MNSVDSDQEDPEYQTNDPSMPGRPVLEDELCRSQVRCDRDGIVEPIVPGQSETIGRGEEPYRVRIEGSFARSICSDVLDSEGQLTCDRVLCGHLSQEEQGNIDDEPDQAIAYEHARGSSLCKRPSSP